MSERAEYDDFVIGGSATTLPATTVLVVHDDATATARLVGALLEAGVARANITTATSLAAARHALVGGAADAVVLDLHLPDAQGLEAVTVMSAALPDAALIVVADDVAEPVAYAALAEGADDHVRSAEVTGNTFRDVLHRARQRRSGAARNRRKRAAASLALDSIAAPAVALDGSGRIMAVNRSWLAAANAGGAAPHAVGIGVNYLAVCDGARGPHADEAAEAAAGIRAVLDGRAPTFMLDYSVAAEATERWFNLRVASFGDLGGGAIVTHLDVTDLKLAEIRLQRSDAHLNGVFDASAPIFALLEADGTFRHVSATTKTALGFDLEELIGVDAFSFVDPADLDATMASFAAVMAVPGATDRSTLRAHDSHGRWREFELVAVNLLDDPLVNAIAVTGHDITESRLAQIARRLEPMVLQRLPTSVVVTDQRGVIVYWNDMAEQIFRIAAEDAIGRPMEDLDLRTDLVEAEAIFQQLLAQGRWEGEYEGRRSDGSVVPLHVSIEQISDEEIDFHGVIMASIDISERRRLEEDLAFQLLHDPLTGLPNRRLFVDHVDNALSRSTRSGRRCAVLFVDLDDFKQINDVLGHEVGDEVLRQVGESVSRVLRTGDLIARLGGDEFAVCCDELTDPAHVYEVVERVREALDRPFRVDGTTVSVSASIGVALSGSAPGADALVRNADAAMYAAKTSGKGRFELFDDALHESVRRRRSVAAELQLGMDSGDVQAYFQPLVSLDSGRLHGFEALVRWTHPTQGPVSPGEFIPIAEETGLIGRLGRLVLVQSCRALAAWRVAAPGARLQVAVNVSGRQLADPTFVATVRSVIAETGVPPEQLCLEVTESALNDADAAAAMLHELKAIGVSIAIDDFGTGYSSLSRLHRFPVDYLKIDRAFVAGAAQRHEDAVIAAAVVSLANTLGLRTVAEGIEDDHELRAVLDLGCDVGQGFLWSRAVPATEAIALVRAGNLGLGGLGGPSRRR